MNDFPDYCRNEKKNVPIGPKRESFSNDYLGIDYILLGLTLKRH